MGKKMLLKECAIDKRKGFFMSVGGSSDMHGASNDNYKKLRFLLFEVEEKDREILKYDNFSGTTGDARVGHLQAGDEIIFRMVSAKDDIKELLDTGSVSLHRPMRVSPGHTRKIHEFFQIEPVAMNLRLMGDARDGLGWRELSQEDGGWSLDAIIAS